MSRCCGRGSLAKEGFHSRSCEVADDYGVDHDADNSYSNVYPDNRNDEREYGGDERPCPRPPATIPQPICQYEGECAEDEAAK